jgi:hypothetical protein
MPESVGRLLAYARHELGCSFVLFDVDVDVLDGFATYDEESTDAATVPKWPADLS